jgi:hypothetical protein
MESNRKSMNRQILNGLAHLRFFRSADILVGFGVDPFEEATKNATVRSLQLYEFALTRNATRTQ